MKKNPSSMIEPEGVLTGLDYPLTLPDAILVTYEDKRGEEHQRLFQIMDDVDDCKRMELYLMDYHHFSMVEVKQKEVDEPFMHITEPFLQLKMDRTVERFSINSHDLNSQLSTTLKGTVIVRELPYNNV